MAKNQTLVQFRVDSDLKNEVSEIYSALGMDVYGAQQNGAWNTI